MDSCIRLVAMTNIMHVCETLWVVFVRYKLDTYILMHFKLTLSPKEGKFIIVSFSLLSLFCSLSERLEFVANLHSCDQDSFLA